MATYADAWTDTSIFCYYRGCRCDGCYIKEILESECKMKPAVIELVRKFGAPNEEKEVFTQYEQRILNLIRNGCKTAAEIGAELNKPESSIKSMIIHMYPKARSLGWNPIKKGKVTKSLFPQFIRWVKDELS